MGPIRAVLDSEPRAIYHYIRIYGLNTLAILDDLSALADITRDRLLLLVESQELTVSELCAVLQLPQSTISRHLKALADAGLGDLASRGHEPAVLAGQGRPGARKPPAVAARPRPGRRQPGCGRGSSPPSGRAGQRAGRSRRSSSLRQPASGIISGRRCLDRRFTSRRSRVCSTPTGWSAISAAARGRSPLRLRPTSRASWRSTTRPRCSPPHGVGCTAPTTSSSVAVISKRCPSRMASSRPRR